VGPLGLALLQLTGAALADEVVVLQLAEDTGGQASEQRFVEELALALDEVAVTPRPVDNPGFARAPLTAQVERVRPWLGSGKADAVAWLDQLGAGQLGLAVVFVTDDRAVVRLVQAEVGPDAEADLALAAREILWSALGDVDPAAGTAAPVAAEEPVATVGRRQVLGARLSLQGALSPVGAVGPTARMGLEGAMDVFIQERLGVGLAVSGWTTPLTELSGLEVRASQVGPALRLQLWSWPVAPFVQVGVPVVWVQIDEELATLVSPRASVGLSGTWGSLMLELRGGVLLFEDQIIHGPTDTQIYGSGRFEVALGVGWRGPG